MGHVERRGDRWRARYRDPDGRSRSRAFGRKADAERFLTGVEHSKLRGSYVDPAAGRITFGEYAEAWRAVQIHRPGTVTSVATHLRLHINPVLGRRPIAAIRPTEVQALVQGLSETLAPSTVEVIYGRVVAVFRAAARDSVIAASPCVGIRRPSVPPPATLQVLSVDQVLAVATAIDPRYRALVVAGAGTGLRPGELFGLRLDRVDFLRRTVCVDLQVTRTTAGGVTLSAPKTPSSYRSVPLPTSVAEALAAHLTAWSPHPDHNTIFTTARGGLVQQHPFAEVWRTACRRAGVPGWATPHDVRHFYASVLIRSGASVKVVQTRLGHASAKTTLDVYGHLFPDEEDRTRAAIDAAFANPAAAKRLKRDA